MRLSGQIADKVGALDGRTADVEAALTRLQTETRLQLFVVFVRSFDGTAARQWVDETGRTAATAAIAAIAALSLPSPTGDRALRLPGRYQLPTDRRPAGPGRSDRDRVRVDREGNDRAGSVIGAADGYRAVLAGQAIPQPKIASGDPGPGGSGGAGREPCSGRRSSLRELRSLARPTSSTPAAVASVSGRGRSWPRRNGAWTELLP
jgi:hypothetical protein